MYGGGGNSLWRTPLKQHALFGLFDASGGTKSEMDGLDIEPCELRREFECDGEATCTGDW